MRTIRSYGMKNKKFDAVQFMRRVRAKMGADMQRMSLEEQQAYIERHASKVRRELQLRRATTVAK